MRRGRSARIGGLSALLVGGLTLATACGGPAGDGRPASDAAGGAEQRAEVRYGAKEGFGFGRPATAEEIAALDLDVGPDGVGLPPGGASVGEGLEVYAARCASCHGADGTGGPYDQLAGRLPDDSFPFGSDPTVRSTVGNYWPYATTLYDYVRKAMPFDTPGSLTSHEVYGSVAAILYFNELVAEDAVVDSATLTDLRMPSRDRFVPDNRTGGPIVR